MEGTETIKGQWQQLCPGQNVKLTGRSGEDYYGLVDDRTADGSCVWVLTMGSGRKLFHVDDGFDIAPGT
ncbi:hypothetical protein ARGLB_077_00330 [Arthrobacter globiformis NBRC 12137]|uniref:Uncharacterized protein n=1 Tax=Arthrobacter globiformis (strain ATCC 8010 / DSM 20124 / JCM 1332 / NBRC 12137 / NCIMB 8907 / NRRL B-2979 / 168) TaxID=1077972 RepID=H0QPR5_ARTG1|nr:hypothetical protein [Arthrobacter globiformis]GAB14816.1 hypothetical protein ARGLB_077_00330 [Arthrobacter globiformis NBRC 12137]